ncbi:hypothetical protein ElyMa_003454700 [Elysia marginata]|uniref:CCHC-type domain-containing protein n=1 Tax=Elysia marginata TaxID=1093978 RepID=A0AAV4E8Q6_9GAST|nr:hypothetical protein ElyMa_003454700 [Elysia marginata]
MTLTALTKCRKLRSTLEKTVRKLLSSCKTNSKLKKKWTLLNLHLLSAKICPKTLNWTITTLCIAVAKIVDREGVLGAQRKGALWRIYLRAPETRATLLLVLAQGLCIGGGTARVSSQNPFIVRGPDSEEIPRTRPAISDVPISFSNAAIESTLTSHKSNIERALEVGPFKAKLFYREITDTNLCFSCQKPGHRARDCPAKLSSQGGEDEGDITQSPQEEASSAEGQGQKINEKRKGR